MRFIINSPILTLKILNHKSGILYGVSLWVIKKRKKERKREKCVIKLHDHLTATIYKL